MSISRAPGFQFLNKEADVPDEPSQSSSPPITLMPDGHLLCLTYLKAPNEITQVKQPEFYRAKHKALQKLQTGQNINRIIETGKPI